MTFLGRNQRPIPPRPITDAVRLAFNHLAGPGNGAILAPRAGSARRDLGSAKPAARSRIVVKRRALVTMGGYRADQPAAYRAWNIVAGSLLLLFSAPLMLVIALALAVTQGPGRIFYLGDRVGKGGRHFTIIKFRTLRPEAAALTRDKVLPPGSGVETMLGKPLRETRLDELPQLLNVLRGDMNLLGPRPVRPSIAEECRRKISGYDRRFDVTPGMIGYTQALMPHGTDKAIRARVNAMLCRRPVNVVQEILFIGVTIQSVLKWVCRVATMTHSSVFGSPGLGLLSCRGRAWLEPSGPVATALTVLQADHRMMLVETQHPLPVQGRPCTLVLQRRRRARGWGKTVRCLADVDAVETGASAEGSARRYRYRLVYRSVTPLQEYLLHRYYLRTALVA